MPPSPALRYSPGREMRASNHKRGRSLESGLLFREKDDDLALFNEMQTKEKENFLLQSSDDIEDTFCNLLYRPWFCNLDICYVYSLDFFFLKFVKFGVFLLIVCCILLCEFELFFTATKLRQFSDFKLGITIPVRGESSDLLNAEEEKNDYDW